MRTPAFTLALLLAAITPLAASAQTTTRGGYVRGGAAKPAAPARPASRALAPAAARNQGGFNLNRDIAAPMQRRTQPVTAYHPRTIVAPPPPNHVAVNRNHPAIPNPAHRGQHPWTWNHGVAWNAAPAYWGGGFWGAFALGAPSYTIAPDSPGAALLANYQLTQTPCGQPDLVVIFGPDDGTICAYPNNMVAPGEYDLDWSTLTLVSRET